MPFPRHAPALLCAGFLLCTAVLSSLAMGSAASEQMAAKRRISLQLRQDLERCAHPGVSGPEACQRQARSRAELAVAELQVQRYAQRQARWRRIAARHRIDPARCNALPRRLRERCVNALPAPETS